MRIKILLIPLLQVALVESLREVSGYRGDNVTLPSGADPSRNLSTIEWSIFSNDTWIATYHDGRKNIDRVPRYKGRLGLNISTGDLTIHNLNTKDAMEYTVDLSMGQENKIKLIVRQRLQKPSLQTVACSSVEGGHWIGLRCSSTDKGVDFSWQVDPPSVAVFNMSHRNGDSAGLLVFLNATRDPVEFTCTSSRNAERASSAIAPSCDDGEPEPQPRTRNTGFFFMGGFVGGFLTVFIKYGFGEKMKASWKSLKEKTAKQSESEA